MWYFDRQGKPITTLEWCKLGEDENYRVIKQETLPDGTYISTVWLGLNHNWFALIGGEVNRRIMIFETMVFQEDTTVQVGRWGTEVEAMAQHIRTVMYYSNKKAQNGN